MSDSPFSFDKARFRQILEGYRIEGVPAIDLTVPEGPKLVDQLVAMSDHEGENGAEQRESILARTQNATVVTDDNMATEFSDPAKLFAPP